MAQGPESKLLHFRASEIDSQLVWIQGRLKVYTQTSFVWIFQERGMLSGGGVLSLCNIGQSCISPDNSRGG
jgi:hypothetical protein